MEWRREYILDRSLWPTVNLKLNVPAAQSGRLHRKCPGFGLSPQSTFICRSTSERQLAFIVQLHAELGPYWPPLTTAEKRSSFISSLGLSHGIERAQILPGTLRKIRRKQATHSSRDQTDFLCQGERESVGQGLGC